MLAAWAALEIGRIEIAQTSGRDLKSKIRSCLRFLVRRLLSGCEGGGDDGGGDGDEQRAPQEYDQSVFAENESWIALLLQLERAGVSENMPCSNTRCMSAGARAEFDVRAHALRRPPHLSTRMLPSAVHIRGLKRRRESKMLGIRGVRQGGYICRQEPWHVPAYK